MDQQNTNYQNRDFIRTDESIVAGQVQKLKKLFKVLAVLAVFSASLSVPIYVSYKTQMRAQEMRIKMDMGQLKNWAIVYELEHSNYEGLDRDPEITRVFNDIRSMGGDAYIIVSKDARKYCCRAKFSEKSLGSWCVDYTGNVGGDGKCEEGSVQCK